MALVLRLNNANFSGQGLPRLSPFAATSALDYAYDFRPGPNQLVDNAGKRTLTAYRNDIANATTIASGSNGLALPQSTINVASVVPTAINAANPGFSASGGVVNVTTSAGVQVVTYTGINVGANQLTGCSGGTGTMSTGGAVNQIKVPDNSIIVQDASGLGVQVQLGFLDTGFPIPASIPIDGSMQFSLMVVGGYSGTAFPSGKNGSTPTICALTDFGTNVAGNSFDIEVGGASDLSFGCRVKSGTQNVTTANASASKKNCGILTYDGTTWTFYNKTSGVTAAATNTSLGISSAIATVTNVIQNAAIGHYLNNSTLAGQIPTMFAAAKWNRVLTGPEIADQYSRVQSVWGSQGV